jgi:hypothetical protein
MAGFPNRIATNRSNPYTRPGAYDALEQGRPLPVFASYLCTANPVPGPPAPVTPYMPPALVEDIQQFVYGGVASSGNAAPPCEPQEPLGTLIGQSGAYPQLQPLSE